MSANRRDRSAVDVGQGDAGGIRRIARRSLGQTQQPNDHKGHLLFLGVAVTDHGGFDLGGGVGVNGNLGSTEGGEDDTTTLGEDEAGFWIPPGETGFHSCAVGSEFGDDAGEEPIEIGQSRRVFRPLGPDDPESLEMGPVAARDDQRPSGGSAPGVDS